MSEPAAIGEIIARIYAENSRFKPEAYIFLNEGLSRTIQEVREREKNYRQITGAELTEGLRQCALDQYGALAKTVLNRWGIHTTRDFGEIVYILLDAGLLGKTVDDKIEDFDDLFDFDTAFRAPFRPAP